MNARQLLFVATVLLVAVPTASKGQQKQTLPADEQVSLQRAAAKSFTRGTAKTDLAELWKRYNDLQVSYSIPTDIAQSVTQAICDWFRQLADPGLDMKLRNPDMSTDDIKRRAGKRAPSSILDRKYDFDKDDPHQLFIVQFVPSESFTADKTRMTLSEIGREKVIVNGIFKGDGEVVALVEARQCDITIDGQRYTQSLHPVSWVTNAWADRTSSTECTYSHYHCPSK